MTRLLLVTVFLGVAACAAEADAGDQPGTSAPCTPLAGPARAEVVLRIDRRTAFEPDVHWTPDGFVAYVASIIPGDGAEYRAESPDGLTWTTPVRVLDDRGTALFQPGGVRLYSVRWAEPGPEFVQGIGSSFATDGIHFADEGLVWTGGNELGVDGLPLDTQLARPLAWFDGARVHLYFTAYGDRAVEDMGFPISSVGHVTSPDGVSFEAARWPFPAHPCGTGPGTYQSLGVWAAVRPACGTCDFDGVSLVLRGQLCDGIVRTFLTHSVDGEIFSEPVPIELPLGGGTLLLAGPQGLYLHGYYEGGTVQAQAITLSEVPLLCR